MRLPGQKRKLDSGQERRITIMYRHEMAYALPGQKRKLASGQEISQIWHITGHVMVTAIKSVSEDLP